MALYDWITKAPERIRARPGQIRGLAMQQQAINDRGTDSVWRSGIPTGPAGDVFAGMLPAFGSVPAPGDVDNFIRTNYPYMAAFLDNPEIGPILRQGALEGWDEQRLYGAVQRTEWWQTTSGSARTWDALIAEDPASAAQRAGQTAATIQNRAGALGLQLSNAAIQGLAVEATRNGWTDAQVIDRLLQNLNWGNVQAGDLTALVDNVKRTAGDYLVQVSDSTAQSYARAIASGEMSEQGVQSVMQAQAVARFGWMSEIIGQGVTPSQYFSPVRDVIANELELAPESVNLMDPRWLRMVEVPGDDGMPRAATLSEAQLTARRDPGYQKTQGAREMAAGIYSSVSSLFGRRGL